MYPTPEQYKESVRQRLKERGLTHRQVCDHIGVPHAMLSQWLAPEKDILLTTVNRIEDALEALSEGPNRGEDLRDGSSDGVVDPAVANLL